MKANTETIFQRLLQWGAGLGSIGLTQVFAADEQPLRAELLSAEQMEQHGKTLASAHRLASGRAPARLLTRLAANEDVLIEVCNLLTADVTANRRITPAAEWLLDNFYLIEEQIRTAKRHFPKGYSRELPRLARGPSSGLPRVYDLALETISHGDGRVDPESLSRFVSAYQTVTALKLGELWAIPIMLRLALIENLRRVAVRVATGMIDRDLADSWADQMTAVADKDPNSLILVTADMARSDPPMSTAFVSEFARRLQGQSAALALPLTWIERLLSESHLTIDQLVQSESQRQASAQVSISNSIASLRFLGAMDWREFVESMSLVEQTLREDPDGVYARMDFATRDHYRHVIETTAKRSRLSELDIARQAVHLARESVASDSRGDGDRCGERAAHVGFYLVDKGLPLLERTAGVRVSKSEALRRWGRQFPMSQYLGAITLITLLLSACLLLQAQRSGAENSMLALVGILALLGTSQLAVALTNWWATLLVAPRPLPRMDFSRGIPREARTLVIVPTMLTGADSIENLAEALEVRFLANRDDHLHFGLLTDFSDALQEKLPGDDALLQLAVERIVALNEKYRNRKTGAACDSFFLFHRPRRWNAIDRIWMGFERKRGKLADLNSLLRGGNDDCFSSIVGERRVLGETKYVITLDTDTQLPRDAARQFVGAMAHPLNRPVFNENRQLVDNGYSILQPSVSVSLSGAEQSRYARLFGSEPGIDPYTRAVSDVYQDVFGEGSFIGKGIYDIDSFGRTLNGRFPENRILSHDLLEGCYARAALLSDVQLYEEYPSRYDADVSRRHRWIRGDWQIASWLLRHVPRNAANGRVETRTNPLSLVSQWKIFDNLRRSLVPAALLLLLLLGWTILSPAWFWTLVVIGITLIASLMATLLELCQKPDDVAPGSHMAATLRAAATRLAQQVFTFACLPYEACFSLDAIMRTNWRILVSKKRLLEWTPSSASVAGDRYSVMASYRTMWIAPTIAIATAVYLAILTPATLAVAGPILLLWVASPGIAWWISRPLPRREARLTPEQVIFLKKNARKTWAFFETFVGPEDNWLPPDNFQEHPVGVVAHRTSPTNMGLALLANLSAYDFGYIGAGVLVERTANTIATMTALGRHRGHFYNWYDTLSLQPLAPLYVSSVDSGNLAGHLLTLRPGLLALADDKIIGAHFFDGLQDTLRVLEDHAAAAPVATQKLLAQIENEIATARDLRPATLAATKSLLARLGTRSNEVVASLTDVPADPSTNAPDNEPRLWAEALAGQCRHALAELTLLTPWSVPPFAPDQLKYVLDSIGIPTLREVATMNSAWRSLVEQAMAPGTVSAESAWFVEFNSHLEAGSVQAQQRMAEIERLAACAGELATMEYDFLYDKPRHLLAIGYNVSEHRQDASYYDMLASEARLCCFVAIAQGQLPQESWFALGRLLTPTGGEPALLSWSGSMFEYLMPLLVMPTFENTLLDRTCHAAVMRQIADGAQRNVAWGISESGYNTVDAALNYQYRAFGVPGLGLKRGLADDLVVAPYASALALMVAPEEACLNLQRLAAEGLAGKFGFYEAVDYTVSRLSRGQSSVVIQSFMAHHQGMVLLSLAYLLLDRPMQKRFDSDPMFQATALLLQERVPKAGAFLLHTARFASIRATATGEEMPVRIINSATTPRPEVQLLSNSHYHVMVTNAGGGYSRWKDLAVTRWREDTTRDNWGTFCYIRDTASGMFWSNTHQPTLKKAETYEAIFLEGRAEFRRRDQDYDTHTEIVASPEDPIELRRVHICNRARVRRTIEVTSYAEVVLARPDADALHPAFSNLFVQTEIIRQRQAILCTRRPRSLAEQAPTLFHLMAVHGAPVVDVSFETDRLKFIGRDRTVAAPQALSGAAALSGSQGSVLDPIVAIRHRITLDPQQTVTIDIVTGIGDTRETALALVEKYQDRRLADRVFELSWTHSQVVLRQINATEADAQLYTRLANSVIYANASLRADAGIQLKNRRGQSGLWGYAISGDLPIVLLQIGEPGNIELVRQLVKAHAYWRLKGLVVDLVIWNEDRGGYRQVLQDQIMGLIAAGIEAHSIDRPGGIFVRSAEHMSIEDRGLFESVARVIISDRRGSLADQINRHGMLETRAAYLNLPLIKPTRLHRAEQAAAKPEPEPRTDLLFHNGLGGFSADGREYVITTAPGETTPAPWVNVMANPYFGTVISDSGMAYTWSENAHEFRLTPWDNDPVCDSSGEAFYLRDEESGYVWSPTPMPRRGEMPYVTRHGFGYSIFEHLEGGVHSELTVYVSLDDTVKFTVLKIRNESGRARRISATGFAALVLGDLASKTAMHVITEVDPLSGALLARNAYNSEFADRVAFFDVDDSNRTFTGDRTEFIGRNGTLRNPAAMARVHLSNKVGAGLDPCAAIQTAFELGEGEEREVIFRLGDGRNINDARKVLQRCRGSVAARDALEKIRQYWQHTLGAVQVETPDPSLNLLINGWLLYQTIACRLWARSGYYQSGGAFGFRDQLQDVMALIHAKPQLTREHLLLCASRQFREGDVQHWWHPPAGRGVRTHCSDDYLWLPLATCRYVLATGDTGVLDESVRFLEGRQVNPDDDSYYDLPGLSGEAASLYQHCVRAILRGLTSGAHGLPLIGGGDWNDGMNMVGKRGKGESIWLGFFLCEVLLQFSKVALLHGDAAFGDRCMAERATLSGNIELHGWDGAWYRRAYFDDGTPLGSAGNEECQIDSISQSWSVLSGAADAKRAQLAMNAVDARLVRRNDAIVQLLDPPFDKSNLDPGYIRGYVAGVRENGGQYTHGAIWAAMAFAAQGDVKRAWELTDIINPVNHGNSAAAIAAYKIEPYVIAADVYGVAPHTSRGGWSWYTGSAGWMYRLVVESLLGLRLEVDKLHFAPCIPPDWPGFTMQYRYRETVYHIALLQSSAIDGEPISPMSVMVDGLFSADGAIALIDDRQAHAVEVRVQVA